MPHPGRPAAASDCFERSTAKLWYLDQIPGSTPVISMLSSQSRCALSGFLLALLDLTCFAGPEIPPKRLGPRY